MTVTDSADLAGEPADQPDADQPDTRVAVRKHSLASRWMHWLNFPLLLIMLWSGLRIYGASDTHAIDVFGVRFDFFPESVFEFFEANRKLAKGIAYHLTFGWFFAINGVAYGAYLAISGRWREIVPTWRALRDVPSTVGHDLGLSVDEPEHGKYNAAQQLAYTAVLVMGAIMLLTGLAIYKPTQLKALTWVFGGYETARLIHFGTALAMIGFFAVHVLQVIRAGWRNFASMVTGYQVADEPPSEQPTTNGPDEGSDP